MNPPLEGGLSLKELNAMRNKEAEERFVREQIKAWQHQAKIDAGSDYYRPPAGLDRLAEHVYCMAWSRQRDKDGRAERDAAEAKEAQCQRP